VIGVGLALAIGRLASGLLFRVSPFDPVVVGGAALVLTTAALVAGYVPARRATRVPPIEALRTE
jgi:putative ABC transport system permease protein